MNHILRREMLIVTLFLFALILPFSDMVFKLDRYKHLFENRELAKAPPLNLTISSIQQFPAAYSKFFNDHFGFRNSLVRANFIFRHGILGVSPTNQVIIGKNGWLFYAGDGEIEDYRGVTKFEAKTLEKWVKTLEMKRVWLNKQGIRYLFVIAPNKSSIYGEFLPESCKRVRERTALDDLVEGLKKHTQVEVVDIRPVLLAAKSKERVYHKTDTHWNEIGAFLAYRQLMHPIVQWYPSLKIDSLDNYFMRKEMGSGLGLASMIGGKEFIKEEYINLNPKFGYSLKIENIDDESKSPVTYVQNISSMPRAIVFRDSFFSSVAPFFARHFQYSKYYWQNWNTSTPIEEMISSQNPDIVIEEHVERYVKFKLANFVDDSPNFIVKQNR